MATAEEVARSALQSVASDAGHLMALRWLSERFAQAVGVTRFRAMREVGEVRTVAEVTGGSVTIAAGALGVVTGDATAQAAWAGLVLPGRFIRFGTEEELYEIAAQDATSLRLKGDHVDGALTAGTYEIFARFYRLDERARFLGAFVHDRRVLRMTNATSLDYVHPGRRLQSNRMWAWSEAAPDFDGVKRVEFYPTPDEALLVRYTFWPKPLEFTLKDQLPPFVDAWALREGVLIDVMRYKSAQAADAGNIEAAAYWRNEYRAQETTWHRHMASMRQADAGSDDVEVLLLIGSSAAPSDIRTARDEVFTRLP